MRNKIASIAPVVRPPRFRGTESAPSLSWEGRLHTSSTHIDLYQCLAMLQQSFMSG
jgi:hypothetical protein